MNNLEVLVRRIQNHYYTYYFRKSRGGAAPIGYYFEPGLWWYLPEKNEGFDGDVRSWSLRTVAREDYNLSKEHGTNKLCIPYLFEMPAVMMRELQIVVYALLSLCEYACPFTGRGFSPTRGAVRLLQGSSQSQGFRAKAISPVRVFQFYSVPGFSIFPGGGFEIFLQKKKW